jgi:hypothetical protein
MAFPSILVLLVLLGQTAPLHADAATNEDASPGGLDVPDPANDVRPTASESPAGLPGAGPTGPHDLLRFRLVHQDAEGLEFELQVADVNAPGAFTTVDHALSFRLAGTPITYALTWSMFTPLAAATLKGTGSTHATFCYQTEDGRCYPQRILATVDWDESILWARVSRDALKGLDPLPGPAIEAAPRFTASSGRLEEFVVYSTDADLATTDEDVGGLYDRLPDAGAAGPLELQEPLSPSGLRIRLDPLSLYDNGLSGFTDQFPVVPVPPNTLSTARVRVYNDEPTPKLVNLSYQFLREGPTDEWGIRLVSTLKVPASGSRLVNIVFTGPVPIPFETRQLLLIQATPLTEPRATAATAFEIVSSAAPPGPERRELFLHLGGSGQEIQGTVNEICRIPFCGGVLGWLNTERVQEAANFDDGRVWGYDITFGIPESQMRSLGRFDLDYPPLHDLVIDLEEHVLLSVRIESQSPITGTLGVQILGAEELIAMGSQHVAITGQQDVVFDLPIVLASERLPAGSNLTLLVDFAHETTALPAFIAAPPRFIAGQSRLVIPFVEDPSPKDETVPAGPALIGLSTADPRETFVNPGNTTLLNVTVVNEGILEDIVHLEAGVSDPSWIYRVVPANDFRLAPGESAVVGVYVKAPATATEGQQAGVEVRASSSADEGARAKLGFVVTVTTGIEVPDEADTYEVDEDTEQNRIAASSTKTPSPGVGEMLGFLVVSVLLLRVRRRPA